jgi:hypothetical protein
MKLYDRGSEILHSPVLCRPVNVSVQVVVKEIAEKQRAIIVALSKV